MYLLLSPTTFMRDLGERVGPVPSPPPERLDTWSVLDLLATTRRWRVHQPFVAGQTDGLARALVACLNSGESVPRWLRAEITAFLLEALWERDPLSAGEKEDLLNRWEDGSPP